jgi:hypothetical protein
MTAQAKAPTKPTRNHKTEQPKNHAVKNRMLTKLRRRKIIEAALDGKDVKAVAISTGLSEKSVSTQVPQILSEPKVKKAFNDILEASGLSDEYLARKIHSMTNATEIRYFSDKGVVTDERTVPALSIQADMVKFAAKVKGHVVERSQVHTITETYIDLTAYTNKDAIEVISCGNSTKPMDDKE